MKKSTLTLIVFISALLSIGGLFGSYMQSAEDQKRSTDMKRCVELKIFPTQGDTTYQIRFEDEFFCPTQPYTVLEALQRAESVLNTRRKPLKLVLKTTPEGIVLESMLGKTNGAGGKWDIEINGSEKFTQPLDKIVLQGRSWINFVYQ